MQLKLTLGACSLLTLLYVEAAAGADWPMFRGPNGSSVAESESLPLEWSVADGKNVAWQLDLPGRGASGPIVVSGKVILTASSGANRDRLHVMAFDENTGEKLWHRQLWATGRTLCHETSAVAAPTPASDGVRIFAYFSSNDMVALDLEGNLLWMRALALDYPGAGNDIGLSSSPVVAGDVVVVQCEAQGNSFVAAMDTRDGSTRWDLRRPEISNWSSPISITDTTSGEPIDAILLQSGRSLSSHQADSGKTLWELPFECNTIPSSSYDGLLFVPVDGMQALDISKRLPADGSPVWQQSKLSPGSPSPVVVDDRILVINSAGVLNCGSRTTGEIQWRKRLGGSFWATPVAAGGHLYCINAMGKGFVVDVSNKGKIISETEFGEDILASPAVANGALFVRSHQHLWKIAH